MRRADDQRIAAQRDAIAELVVGLDVLRLQRRLQRPVVHVARVADDAVVIVIITHQAVVQVDENGAAVVVIASGDDRGGAVDRDARPGFALAHLVRHQQIVSNRRPFGPALAEVVDLVGSNGAVRGAGKQEAFADVLAAAAEVKRAICIRPHLQDGRRRVVQEGLESLQERGARVVHVQAPVAAGRADQHAVGVERN